MSTLIIEAMERRLLPDMAIRFGIRKLCHERLKEQKKYSPEKYVQILKASPVAIHTDDANKQHYELPPLFFELVLGKNRKYSSSFWSEKCLTLDEAEDEALRITIERAELKDGMNILELGCGWGSLTLAMARSFPNARIVAVSNSTPQREFIEKKLKEEKLKNVTVLTQNIAHLMSFEGLKFDRVVSVEMFEHLRNYHEIMKRISSWLAPEGKLFIHIFTHKNFSYFFDTEGDDNWMGQHFFTGGQMPADNLLPMFQDHLLLEKKWHWDGNHYGKTSEAWLKNLDSNKDFIMPLLDTTYGKQNAERWFQRWRIFFMSCAELFNFRNGKEWGVSHYLFSKRSE